MGTSKTLAAQATCGNNIDPNLLVGNDIEGSTVSLTCPKDNIIRSVLFASYGTPSGDSLATFLTSSCDSPSSVSSVESQCVGQHTCQIAANNGCALSLYVD